MFRRDNFRRQPSFDLPKPVEVGKEYDVVIAEVGAKGDGIARVSNFVIFVANTKKDDKVKIKITSVGRSFAVGEKVGEGAEEKPAETTEAKEEATETTEEKPAEATETKEEASETTEEKPAETTETKEEASETTEEKPAETTEAKEEASEEAVKEEEVSEEAKEEKTEESSEKAG